MKPLEERVKEFMESNNFEQTLYGNYSGRDAMIYAEDAALFYRITLEARRDELERYGIDDEFNEERKKEIDRLLGES